MIEPSKYITQSPKVSLDAPLVLSCHYYTCLPFMLAFNQIPQRCSFHVLCSIFSFFLKTINFICDHTFEGNISIVLFDTFDCRFSSSASVRGQPSVIFKSYCRQLCTLWMIRLFEWRFIQPWHPLDYRFTEQFIHERWVLYRPKIKAIFFSIVNKAFFSILSPIYFQ